MLGDGSDDRHPLLYWVDSECGGIFGLGVVHGFVLVDGSESGWLWNWRPRPGLASAQFGNVTALCPAEVSCSPLVEDDGVAVGGAEGEDGTVAHRGDVGGQLGGVLVVG